MLFCGHLKSFIYDTERQKSKKKTIDPFKIPNWLDSLSSSIISRDNSEPVNVYEKTKKN